MNIPKKYAHLAVEYTSKTMETLRDSTKDNQVVLEKANHSSLAEKKSLEAFYEQAKVGTPSNPLDGVRYEEISKTKESLHHELTTVDTDQNGISIEEKAQLSAAGKAAMELAQEMMAKQPVQAMSRQLLDGKTAEEKLQIVREASLQHIDLGYGVARAILFSFLDNQDGEVTEVYLHQKAAMNGVPDSQFMNTEHTWPKSRGVKKTPAESDLHHLYPTNDEANGKRSSFPFGEVQKILWQDGESKLGTNAQGIIVFEPPEQHKGNVARSLFYVAASYDLPFIEGEPQTLLRWNQLDPVDDTERKRNEQISLFQGNRNPFVDQPDLVEELVSVLFTKKATADMYK